MEALEPNMYVRTKKGIAKIKTLDDLDNVAWTDVKDIFFGAYKPTGKVNFVLYDDGTVLKASRNIIDLIEVGDIITTNNLCGQVTHIEGDKIYTTCYDGEYCYGYQIKSIVTKEMFESMSYEVK